MLKELQDIVSGSGAVMQAKAEDKLISLPTGDGMALVFFGHPEFPVECALEIGRAVQQHPAIKLRIGIHTGPVYRVADINANRNVAGGGINIAQRVMDCGDAGHILLSRAAAEVIGDLEAWHSSLRDLGLVDVKHGVQVHIFNLCTQGVGNPELPQKVQAAQAAQEAERIKRQRRKLFGVVVATAVLVALGVSLAFYVRWRRSSITLPFQHMTMRQITYSGKVLNVAISQDGKYVAYLANEGDGQRSLRMRRISDGAETQLLRSGNSIYTRLTFSPDGDFLYFVRHEVTKPGFGVLYRMPVLGGRPQEIAQDIDSAVSFSPDGRQMVFVRDRGEENSRIIVAGSDGTGERVVAQQSGWMYGHPAWSRNGKQVAVLVSDVALENPAEVRLLDLTRATEQNVYSGEGIDAFLSNIRWIPSGRSLLITTFSDTQTLQARIEALSLSDGKIHPITHDVNVYGEFDLSSDGKQMVAIVISQQSELYTMSSKPEFSGSPLLVDSHVRDARWLSNGYLLAIDDERRIIRMQPDGSDRAVLLPDAHAFELSVCPDGRNAFFGSEGRIWRLDLRNYQATRLTSSYGDRNPVCAPDSKFFIFASLQKAKGPPKEVLMKMAIDGGPATPLGSENVFSYAFSPDGQQIAQISAEHSHTNGTTTTESGQSMIEFLPAKGGPVSRRIVAGDSQLMSPIQYSADGQEVYYIAGGRFANIVKQRISGGTPVPVTSFHDKLICAFDYDWKNKRLVVMRGVRNSDIVLITQTNETE